MHIEPLENGKYLSNLANTYVMCLCMSILKVEVGEYQVNLKNRLIYHSLHKQTQEYGFCIGVVYVHLGDITLRPW